MKESSDVGKKDFVCLSGALSVIHKINMIKFIFDFCVKGMDRTNRTETEGNIQRNNDRKLSLKHYFK